MSAPTLADFRKVFPEFSTSDDGDVERWLEEATYIHTVNPRATLWCAAHLLAMYKDASALPTQSTALSNVAGIKSEKVGPMEVTYQTRAEQTSTEPNKQEKSEFFSQTSYGRHFLIIEARTPAVAFSVRAFGNVQS